LPGIVLGCFADSLRRKSYQKGSKREPTGIEGEGREVIRETGAEREFEREYFMQLVSKLEPKRVAWVLQPSLSRKRMPDSSKSSLQIH
jgi:hypothetical protein